MKTRLSRYTPSTRLVSNDAYNYYLKTRSKAKIHTYLEFSKIARAILDSIATHLIKSVGGVVVDKFGYLCHWRTPHKLVFKLPREEEPALMTNFHTDQHFYISVLFSNIFKRDLFRGWTLDRSFSDYIKQGLAKELLVGKKYKCHYDLVRNLYTDKYIDRSFKAIKQKKKKKC